MGVARTSRTDTETVEATPRARMPRWETLLHGDPGMLAGLVPDGVVVVETERDLIDVDLFPAEVTALGDAVESRRREFVTGRTCARQALARIGVEPGPIGAGARGEPLWPSGVVGSIAHCRGYRACAVARASVVASIGIDAEVEDRVSDRVLAAVSSPRERQRLRLAGDERRLGSVLFSAKESVYKAWFPLTGLPLDFGEVDVSLDASTKVFGARLLVPGPIVDGERLTELRGRWTVARGMVATAIVVPAAARVTGAQPMDGMAHG